MLTLLRLHSNQSPETLGQMTGVRYQPGTLDLAVRNAISDITPAIPARSELRSTLTFKVRRFVDPRGELVIDVNSEFILRIEEIIGIIDVGSGDCECTVVVNFLGYAKGQNG